MTSWTQPFLRNVKWHDFPSSTLHHDVYNGTVIHRYLTNSNNSNNSYNNNNNNNVKIRLRASKLFSKKKLIRNLWAVLKTNLIDPLVVPLLTFCRCLLFRWLDYWEREKNDSNFYQRKRVHWPLILGWTMNSDFIDNDLTYLNEHFPIENKSSWSEILKCNHCKCIVKIWSIV